VHLVLEAGRVGRPHGLDGSFYVTRPSPDVPLAEGAQVEVGGVARRIVRRAGTDGAPIVRLEGCETRADADALRGTPLLVDEADAPPLAEDEFWAHELAGCRVVDGDREVGEVARMVALPSCEALEIGDRLIPLVRDAIRSIDRERRVIDVDLRFLGE
jgi:16S rRNA processing protein RimM